MKVLPLKWGVVQVQGWCLALHLFCRIGFCTPQNFVSNSDSDHFRHRIRGEPRSGPHLIAGAVPLPPQQFVPTPGIAGIAQNFVRIDSNHGRFNGSSTTSANKNTGFTTGGPSPNGNQNLKPHLLINMGLGRGSNDSVKYIRVSNQGSQDEFVQMTVLDSKGNSMRIIPAQFPLGVGATAEIPFNMPAPHRNLDQSQPLGRSKVINGIKNYIPPTDDPSSSSEMITVLARGKRDSVTRSFVFGDPFDGASYNIEPFCVDKDVTGTCRYRDDPVDCFRWEWTAYATILNNFGPDYKITSIPEGLFVSPGEHGRVRVYLKFSCCTPVVQFVLTDTFSHTAIKSCVVDVRELQHLHPGEIAGIVVAAVLLVLIIIAVIIICARKRRKETINKKNGGMIPRLRSRTRSRSKQDMEVIGRQ